MLSEGALWWRDAPRLHRPSVDEQAETADAPMNRREITDAESTAIVMRLLRQVADDGTSVLMVTHDPDALAYVDHTYRMDRECLLGPDVFKTCRCR